MYAVYCNIMSGQCPFPHLPPVISQSQCLNVQPTVDKLKGLSEAKVVYFTFSNADNEAVTSLSSPWPCDQQVRAGLARCLGGGHLAPMADNPRVMMIPLTLTTILPCYILAICWPTCHWSIQSPPLMGLFYDIFGHPGLRKVMMNDKLWFPQAQTNWQKWH